MIEFWRMEMRSEPAEALKKENPMVRPLAAIGFSAALAILSSSAFAEQGNSSSWGSYGWGPVIPTQSLTPRERQWNFDSQPAYQAQYSAEWLRQHGKGLFPFFQ
jgi:hypothetical protein